MALTTYRPATPGQLAGWFAASGLIALIAAAVVGYAAGLLAYASMESHEGFADLGAVVLGMAVAFLLGVTVWLVASFVAVRRFVPEARRRAARVQLWLLVLVVAVLVVLAFQANPPVVVLVAVLVLGAGSTVVVGLASREPAAPVSVQG